MPAGDSVDCCSIRMKAYIANATITNIKIIFLEDVFISVFIGFHIMPRKLYGFFMLANWRLATAAVSL